MLIRMISPGKVKSKNLFLRVLPELRKIKSKKS
jgi:hypothetical protein